MNFQKAPSIRLLPFSAVLLTAATWAVAVGLAGADEKLSASSASKEESAKEPSPPGD